MPEETSMHMTIKRLLPSDASELSVLINSATPGYSEYFTPFEFSASVIQDILERAVKDHYYGILVNGSLAGFFMLRGFDQGYEIPVFGVWIAEKYQGIGLSRMAIYYCYAVCRVNGVGKLMLKVYPDNTRARQLYEKLGFVFSYVDEKNGNRVYFKEL